MTEVRAPGVRIQHVLTEPARILRTGVPAFLGLVSTAAIDEWNRSQELPDERYMYAWLGEKSFPAVVRKQGYLELPSRAAAPGKEPQLSDRAASDPSMYLRATRPAARQLPENYTRRVLRSAGAAGALPARSRAPASSGEAGQGSDAGEKQPAVQELSTKPQRFTIWPQYRQTYADLAGAGFLSYAVRGFFENGGTLCYVQLLAYESKDVAPGEPGASEAMYRGVAKALCAGLQTLAPYDDYDLVCVPDLLWEEGIRTDLARLVELQNAILNHCNRLGDRMAILDPLPGGAGNTDEVTNQRSQLTGENIVCESTVDRTTAAVSMGNANGALYYPWVRVPGGPEQTNGYVPPCGHVAGIYARTDQRIGAHKAPANEVIDGVIDLASQLSDDDQAPLNDAGINCLRAFPHRGIRVWGARTLSRDATWRYVNVRRVILTAVRWITRNMNDVVYEPHSEQLWARITRELTAYFGDLARSGALAGGTDQDAFYVKCDAETNPPETRETGQVVTEIGLRPTAPAEFIVIRIIHGPTGAEITTA